jgi:hypothetical protein
MLASGNVWVGTFAASLVMLAAASGWMGAGTLSAQVPVTGGEWQQISTVRPDADFSNVFMAGVNSGIAVGKQGDRGVAYELQWMPLDGSRNTLRLTPISFDFRAPLRAAVVVNQDVWVVGEQGLIARRQNGAWGEVANPVPDAQLLTLQMLGNGEEGWAGGFRPTSGGWRSEPVILHYTNGQWQRDDSITGEGTINALHFAPGGGWAVGNVGIWRYANGAWSKEQEPNPCPEVRCYPTYSAVRAISGDEVWIAGHSMALCGICVPNPYLLHGEGSRWEVAVHFPVPGDPTRPGAGRALYGLTFAGSEADPPMRGWAVGTIMDNFDRKPYILSHSSSQAPSEWQYVPYPAGVNTQLTSVSAPDTDHAVAVGTGGVILSFGYGPQTQPAPLSPTPGGSNPTQRVPDPRDPNVTYFEPVGHTLRGGFRDYWQQHGDLPQFGYPLTEEFTEISPTDGKPYVTQYFERARFEYHPENRPPYDVLLGLLGRTITQGRQNEQPFRPRPPNPGKGGPLYFPQTGHFMDPVFTDYWRLYGGLPVYGYPISEAFMEVSPTDGKPYLVQYFERNRLEYHPELPASYRVSLGLLGVQVLQERGWIK